MIRAYKGFHKDLTCTMGNGIFQYRENEWMEETGAECVRKGFHCCYNPLDCLSYYSFKESVFYLVCAGGDIHEDGSDTKIACTRIKLVKRLSAEEFAAHALAYMTEHPHLKTNSTVKRESACGGAHDGLLIVRGKNPSCSAQAGTVVGMAQEAPDSHEIVAVTVYRVDGKKYLENTAYLVNGKEAAY